MQSNQTPTPTQSKASPVMHITPNPWPPLEALPLGHQQQLRVFLRRLESEAANLELSQAFLGTPEPPAVSE